MILEYYGVAKENLKSGISVFAPVTARNKHIKAISTGSASEMLDWMNLPDMSEKEHIALENVASKCRKMKDFVVLGIGGSALGIRLLNDTFVESISKEPTTKVTVCDNIDSDKFLRTIDTFNLKKTMFNVITKSGSTSETLAQMLLLISKYNAKKINYREHIIVTTTEGNDLWNWALNEGISVLSIPKGVGGRYSVLSNVGLLPAKVMGLDVRALLKGAKKAREYSFRNDSTNLAYISAYINYNFYKKGLTNLVTMPYSDRLALLPEFFAQLWAESLGKKVNRKGETIYAGQTPIKTIGVTDQHSQLQLYSEGPKDKLIMFLTVDKVERDEKIEVTLPFTSHLTGVSLKELLDNEYNATAYSLTSLDRPNYTIALEEISEESVGELIFMLEMMTAYMGEMMDIDAFNQPGVELSKIYTKAMLGVKIEQTKAKEIKEYMKNKKKFVI
jgi:glucose-6-phosphate isomerase